MTGQTFRATCVALATAAFLLSPVVSQSFGGFEPGQFPVAQDDPPAQPAGWAFSIWSLIYAWLAIHAAYGLWKRRGDPGWDATRLPLILSLTLGAAWIPVALRSPLLATAIIWAMLATALWALLAAPARDRWLVRVPLAIYAGWLTAAACVSVALIGAGWGIGPGALGWAWIALALAMTIAVPLLLRLRPAPDYAAPIAWALVAIAAVNYGPNLPLAIAGLAGAAALLALSLFPAR